MTNKQFKICAVVVRKRRLGDILAVFPQFDYLSLQEALPPRALDFSDASFDDDTLVTLSPLMQEAFDHACRKLMTTTITLLLAAAGVLVSILKP